MCEICRQTPCHPRCPNADDDSLYECDICHGGIYEGDTMYCLDDKRICQDCIDNSTRTAEKEEPDYDE